MPHPLTSSQSGALRGIITPPGDKSISHRSIMLGGIAKGETTVRGLLEGEDVLHTVAALRQLGAVITQDKDAWHIIGTGLHAMRAPTAILDIGNSGTSARLLMGMLATQNFTSIFTGDASLRKRPMKRVTTPLEQFGATFQSSEGGTMPLTMKGAAKPTPVTYKMTVASAQVKSAVLLAGLNCVGKTTVIENIPTRDHSERMLRHFGATVDIEQTTEGEAITITGQPVLFGQDIVVPADISSAAFPMVAALLRPESKLTLLNVGINTRRAGLLTTLLEMGANIVLKNHREQSGEPVADIEITASALKGITVPAERAPSMIDEYPVLAMAAACADGVTRMCGLGELRVKESDRLALVAEGLTACGVQVEIEGDDLIVQGNGKPPKGGASIKTALDHRIAMSFLVLGCATHEAISIDDGSMIATSFPNFVEMMNRLGARIND